MALLKADRSLLGSKEFQDIVANQIGSQIYAFMMRPTENMDVSQSLVSLGVDSIVTTEIRNWLKRNFDGLELSTLEILNAGTIQRLGALIVEGLRTKVSLA
jgi:aryl carrier-like protein